MKRALAAVAAFVIAASVAWWLLGPAAPSPVKAPPPPPPPIRAAEAPQTPKPFPVAPAPAPPLGAPIPDGVPTVAPRPIVDPDRVYDTANGGVRAALFDRWPQLLACVDRHAETFGAVRGRPTLRATVDRDGTLDVRVENDGDGIDTLDACVADATAALTFAPPDVPTTVLYPIPVPRRAP